MTIFVIHMHTIGSHKIGFEKNDLGFVVVAWLRTSDYDHQNSKSFFLPALDHV